MLFTQASKGLVLIERCDLKEKGRGYIKEGGYLKVGHKETLTLNGHDGRLQGAGSMGRE